MVHSTIQRWLDDEAFRVVATPDYLGHEVGHDMGDAVGEDRAGIGADRGHPGHVQGRPGTARRCLVPADAFYEWKVIEGGKPPYAIAREALLSAILALGRKVDEMTERLAVIDGRQVTMANELGIVTERLVPGAGMLPRPPHS
jgi:hypothetical protein